MDIKIIRWMQPKAVFAIAAWMLLFGCAAPGAFPEVGAPEEPPPQTSLPENPPTAVPTQIPAIPESRWITIEWPPDIKVGDSDIIRLTLDLDRGGDLTVTAQVSGNETRSEPVSIPNLYETHNVLVEARMDLAGVIVSPEGVTSESLLPGEPAFFAWSVKPEEVGNYRGTIWLHLVFIPKEGGVESRRALSAQRIDVRAVNFLGLGGSAARWLGGLGTLVGSFISLDSLVPWVFKRLRRKRSK